MPAARPAAILFDLDGTLLDSEPVWAAAMRCLWAGRGLGVSDALLESLSGLDAELAMRLVHRMLGWPGGDIAADLDFVQNEVRERYIKHLVWRPGARSLVSQCRAGGLPTALVTSTYRHLVEIVLHEAGVDAFDAVVCGDDGHQPKPHPAPYLAAAARLGVAPTACVAVEDSRRGVASALAAGCTVLRVSAEPDRAGAHARVATLTAVSAAGLCRLLAEAQPPPAG